MDSPVGEEGFSDGDVLIHAIIDALIGTTGLGDIGVFFPPGEERYRNISSRILLRETKKILNRKKMSIINIDCTVILEKPKISPYRADIINNLASDLQVPAAAVSVKAKTKEGIDETGAGKAVEAFAVALVSDDQV